MSWAYRTLLRPWLFSQDSEKIHNRTLRVLAAASRSKMACDALAAMFQPPEMPVQLFGLRFPNPVGLAAGMDKAAAAVPVWAALGFGFSELGGVTWKAQPGNPAPRMFRATAHGALVNRMGFNNPGAEAVAAKLAQWRARNRWPAHPVGMNLGKSKDTPLEDAAEDYARSLCAVWPHADFFVVNVSSPNTPNLRDLQDREALDEILMALQETNQTMAQTCRPAHSAKPILVKVAPDLSVEALDEILELAKPREIAGIVATNTTILRPTTENERMKKIYEEAGGLSGRPLRKRSNEVISHIYRQTRGELPIIGVGGIFTAADAWEKITAGASLVQVYTGMVYEGPGVAKEIVDGLRVLTKSMGYGTLTQAVGSKANSAGGADFGG
jgi:dihydroorotate dehydrogenase